MKFKEFRGVTIFAGSDEHSTGISETKDCVIKYPKHQCYPSARCYAMFINRILSQASKQMSVTDKAKLTDEINIILGRLQRPTKAVITAGMPYANGPLHAGHLAGAQLPADIYARYMRMMIGGDNVLFVNGTDDHGSNSQVSAKKMVSTLTNSLIKFTQVNLRPCKNIVSAKTFTQEHLD